MRKKVHIGMAVVMGITIFVFNLLNNTSVIDAVYILASYTYGPIPVSYTHLIMSEQLAFNDGVDELLQEGMIQRFEYTHELAWKVMKLSLIHL